LFQLMYVIELNDLRHFVNLLAENEKIRDLNHQKIRLLMNANVQ
jgi:hypothetical protein